MQTPHTDIDVAIVGGGLAGLSAAAFAARAGASVLVLDARSSLGGRARTSTLDGFRFNEGPHALYRGSPGAAAVRELGISPQGGGAPKHRSRFSLDGRLRRTPPRQALTQFLGLVRHLGADGNDPGLVRISAQEWIEGRVGDPLGRQFAASAVRVSSYSGDLSTFSADAAVAQLSASMRGVTYLHHGWVQLVSAVEGVARAGGAIIDTDAKVSTVEPDGDRVVIELVGGRRVVARSVVLAVGGPSAAARLVGGRSASLDGAAASAVPVHAACLDVGLRRLTKPSTRFVLGVDKATYASVHTPAARLADHGHVAHLMYYEPGDHIGVSDLEALADELQPGWRDEEAARQVGRRRVVAFDRPQPGAGLSGRPGPAVADLPGVFVAGDWVGPSDLLGGAALSSGRAAGLAACRRGASDRSTFSVANVP